MDPLLVISNADAGTADEESLAAALAVLREHCSVEVQATSRPGELDSALHRAGSRRIVVAGGDGSLHAVVAALHRRNDLKGAVLGLLPLGTGNDFARANDIPLDVEEAARTVLEGDVRAMDLVVDEVGEIVVNNVHAGVGAVASRRGAPRKGQVDVMVSRTIGPVARVGYGVQLAAGRHPERDDVIYLRGSTVTVSGDEFWCSADGEIYGPERHRSWHVEPAAYSMVVPR